MEIVRANKNGEDMCFVRCEIHNWFFKGMPPITAGCKECWNAYYFALHALNAGKMGENTEMLEEALHHSLEAIRDGKFDLKVYDKPEVLIEKGND